MSVFAGVQTSGVLCSIVRAKLIALWIGPAGVGLNALLSNAFMMLSQLAQLGISVSGVREIASAGNASLRHRAIAAVLRWSVLLGMAGGALTLLLSPLLSWLTFDDFSHSWMFAVMSVAVLASVVSAGRQAVLQGTEDLQRLARLMTLSVLLSTAMAAPLFWWLRLQAIPWVVLMFAVVPAVLYLTDSTIRHHSRPSAGTPEQKSAASFISLGAALTLSSVLTIAAGYILTVFLNRFASMSEVGIYQAGYSVINNYLGVLVTALSVGYYPLLSSQAHSPRRCAVLVSRQLWLITCLLLVAVPVFLLCRRLIVWILYTPQFYTALPYLTLAVGGGALKLISNSMATMMLVKADIKAYMASEIISEIIGLGLSIAGYLLWGIAGMGLAYTLWYALYTVAAWLIVRCRYGMTINCRVTVFLSASMLTLAVIIALTAYYL